MRFGKSMANKIEISEHIGVVYGKLTVMSESAPHYTLGGNKKRIISCKCDCGEVKDLTMVDVFAGRIVSCGCHSKEMASIRAKKRNTTHGAYNTVEHSAWSSMLKRCTNPNHKHYKHYGGRGISVCDRWKISFNNFLADMGERPSKEYSLDRIDVDGNYSPDTCRWATNIEQQRNTTANINITYNGATKCLAEWCEELKLNYAKVHYRLTKAGWSVEKAFT